MNTNAKKLYNMTVLNKKEIGKISNYTESSFDEMYLKTTEEIDSAKKKASSASKSASRVADNLLTFKNEGFKSFEDDEILNKIFVFENGNETTKTKGTAVLVRKNYFITNEHNIVYENQTIIKTYDGIIYSNLTLLNKSSDYDLALFKIENYSGTPISFASLSSIKLSIPVYLIGHGFGYDFSISSGIVSNQRIFKKGDYNLTFVQHDAPANKGNSGGPLVNSKGELIGIHSGGFVDRIYDYGKEGISFAIRIDEVEEFIKVSLNETG
jgi:S1-C subfamily serine protease